MSTAVTLREVDVGWGPRHVLLELSLEIRRGEALCIVGPGGSGKSTLLQTLEQVVAGHPPATTGDRPLWWRGQLEVAVTGCRRLRQHGSASPRPVGEWLARANLDLSWLGADDRATINAAADLPFNQLSDPLRRVLSFARVAESSAPLLLFDEPLFSLPQPWSARITEVLSTLGARDRTSVIVTHNLTLARAVADRIALLIDGRLIESGSTEDFFCRATHPRTRRFLQWGG